MVYLESMNIVHRDLAARNLLVDGDGIVKVVHKLHFCSQDYKADFGMSKLLQEKHYDKIEGVVPIRW